MLKKLKIILLILLAFTGLLTIGCENKEPVVIKTPPTEAPEQVEKDPQIPDWYIEAPLTGQKVDPRYVERRPVAVMVENTPAARPQSGLAEADIVYEILAEGGIARFLAIYHSQDSHNVGPIRSARPYYIERALEYDALYVHCGGSEEAKRYIKESKVADMDEFGLGRQGQAFWRIKTRKAPHNLYGDSARIRELAIKKGYKERVEVPKWSFLEDNEAIAVGNPATKLIINYPNKSSKVTYNYDLEQKSYLRTNGGLAHKDAITGQTLKARNIIVQYTNTKTVDSVGRLKIDMIGRGKAILFLEGMAYEGTWEKKGARSRTVFRDINEKEFKLRPGQTWIQVVPAKARIEYQ